MSLAALHPECASSVYSRSVLAGGGCGSNTGRI
jgi:hypothetical protein